MPKDVQQEEVEEMWKDGLKKEYQFVKKGWFVGVRKSVVNGLGSSCGVRQQTGSWMKFLLKLIYSLIWNLIRTCLDLDRFPVTFSVTPKTDTQPVDSVFLLGFFTVSSDHLLDSFFWAKMRGDRRSASFHKEKPAGLSRALSWLNMSPLSQQGRRFFHSQSDLHLLPNRRSRSRSHLHVPQKDEPDDDDNWVYRPQHKIGETGESWWETKYTPISSFPLTIRIGEPFFTWKSK